MQGLGLREALPQEPVKVRDQGPRRGVLDLPKRSRSPSEPRRLFRLLLKPCAAGGETRVRKAQEDETEDGLTVLL